MTRPAEAETRLAAAEAAAAARDLAGAVRLAGEAIGLCGEPALMLRAALLHAGLGRPASACALARAALAGRDDSALGAIGIRVAGQLHVTGAPQEATAVLLDCWRARPDRATIGLLLAAGLPAFRRGMQDGPDLGLLQELVAAACLDPTAMPEGDLAELARLAEEAGRDDLLRRLGAAALAQGGRALAERMTRPGLGVVQSLAGLAHHATHRQGRAAIAFAAAHAGLPADPSARFNAGYAALAAGDAAAAAALLGGLPAAGASLLAGAAWPHFGELPWPFAAPPEAARRGFEARLPPGARWPRIRLVTPCLNPGPWLEETILSVAAQGYPAVEHVVVDGGSTDGTAAVLARHRDRLHAVIVGPDGGPAEAIGKGFAGTEADLVGWINADDLLAPGALHALGAAWAADPGADLVHGWSVAHRARRITTVQQPLAEGQGGFTVAALADVFGRWGDGRFFLQPEVLIARRCWDRLGGRLDTGLKAVFDYEVWLRAAQAGARIAQVRWPVAFYRTHAGQLSGQRAAVALEQATVRDRFAAPAPAPTRVADVTARLRAALQPQGRPARLLLIDPRCAETISATAHEEARAALASRGIALEIRARAAESRAPPDLVLRLLGAHDGDDWVPQLRGRGFAGPAIGWFLEDDRDAASNAAMALAPDIVVPSRPRRRGILLQENAVVTAPMAPPCGLVSMAEARAAFAAGPTPGPATEPVWQPGPVRLAAALRDSGALAVAGAGALALALLAGRVPVMADAGLTELFAGPLPDDSAGRHALGLDWLLAARLGRLMDRLADLAGG
ncbi:glycosyltransferase [Roseomonas sp. CAU 1739]|uniref:glycosyltransferase n=1 Tax=Roseomonas sp. CAU 1739 TaxID=3140364 RepID=UPI00325B07A3